jgi:hypothetical protein
MLVILHFSASVMMGVCCTIGRGVVAASSFLESCNCFWQTGAGVLDGDGGDAGVIGSYDMTLQMLLRDGLAEAFSAVHCGLCNVFCVIENSHSARSSHSGTNNDHTGILQLADPPSISRHLC